MIDHLGPWSRFKAFAGRAHRACPVTRFGHRWRTVVAYLIFAAIIALAFHRSDVALSKVQAQAQAIEAESQARVAAQCQQTIDVRTVIRSILSAPSPPLPLTSVPAYSRLGPDLQEYFREIQQVFAASSSPSMEQRARLLALVPLPVDCGPGGPVYPPPTTGGP